MLKKKKFIVEGHRMPYELIVIGVSAGGLVALSTIFPKLSAEFSIPIVVVQHVGDDNSLLVEHLNNLCVIPVIEVEDKFAIQKNTIYIAPAGYHLLIEDKNTLALSFDPKVNYSRPSIDVLFESAADVFKEKLMGVVLSGANTDGVSGAKKIKSQGGFVIVQSIETSEAKIMPAETIKMVNVDIILPLEDIGPFLQSVERKNE